MPSTTTRHGSPSRDDVEFSFLRLFTQPNVPDVRAHLLSQDVILVEGGSVVNLIAVWRAHGLPEILRECWEAGIVLTGASAGSLCWHVGGPTDSFRDSLDPFTGGLAFLPYSNGVHDDLDDQPRRAAFRELIANGELPAGYATEDGAGLLYAGTSSSKPSPSCPAGTPGTSPPTATAATRSKPSSPASSKAERQR